MLVLGVNDFLTMVNEVLHKCQCLVVVQIFALLDLADAGCITGEGGPFRDDATEARVSSTILRTRYEILVKCRADLPLWRVV